MATNMGIVSHGWFFQVISPWYFKVKPLSSLNVGRSYDQFCPLAVALDAIGDRWALLIVRELLLGPRRFGQLVEGLPGIGTDILTARLRDLETARVISRRAEGRARWYELTRDGRALVPAIRELVTWGARRLSLPPDMDTIWPRSVLTSICSAPVGHLDGVDGRYEVRTGDEVATVEVAGGRVTAAQGEAGDATARVMLTTTGLLALAIGSPLDRLARTGEAEVEGDEVKAGAVLEGLADAGIGALLNAPR
jgi:DNA-binding HxlR family transcriptional regulator